MLEYYGYAGRILRIDLTKNQVKIKPTEKKLIVEFLGGRSFNSKRLYEEVPKNVAPFPLKTNLCSPPDRLLEQPSL